MKRVEQSSMHLDIHVGEALLIDEGRISVELEAKSGKIARLRVRSPRHVTVERKRLNEDEENKTA
jgi:sRNA-binding carbon storage regulator CsrA